MYIPTKIVGLDFETYYDDKYTLKKMSTTAYIRDPQFLVHGVGIRTNRQEKTQWYRRRGAESALSRIDWNKCAILAHNAHFEGLILSHHYGIKPAYYYDTVSMGRALFGMETRAGLDILAKHLNIGAKVEGYLEGVKGERNPPQKAIAKLAEGCIRDVDLMWQLFRLMLSMYPESELDLIYHTVCCFAQPILQVNKEIALKEHKKEVFRRRYAVRKVFIPKGERLTKPKLEECVKKLRSRPYFAGMLTDLGVDPPLKISPSNPEKFTYAFAKTDLQFLELQEHPKKEVRDLVNAKLVASSSIHETRPLRMIEHSDPALTIYLNYAGAGNTHRWSGGDKMNPQNMSRDSQLRNAIEAPKGYKLVIGDSSAIEAGLNACLAGQWDLVQQFKDYYATVRAGKPDASKEPYCQFASRIFGRPIDKSNKIERYVGKTCILALGYQMGPPRFQFTLETGMLGPKLVLEIHLYKEYVDLYRREMDQIVKQWWFMDDRLQDMLFRDCHIEYRDCITFAHRKIIPPNELPLNYPNLRRYKDPETGEIGRDFVYREKTKLYGGKVVENVIQNLARTVVAEQIARVAENYRPVLMVHDEGVFAVPTRYAKKAAGELLESLSTPPEWMPELPVSGEVGIFEHYVKM